MTQHTALAPVRKQISVDCDVETAFRTFTEDIATWWPVESHSITGEGTTPVFEQRAGGRLYERAPDRQEHDWAAILAYEPPHRVGVEGQFHRPTDGGGGSLQPRRRRHSCRARAPRLGAVPERRRRRARIVRLRLVAGPRTVPGGCVLSGLRRRPAR
jgi:hypothetical protein